MGCPRKTPKLRIDQSSCDNISLMQSRCNDERNDNQDNAMAECSTTNEQACNMKTELDEDCKHKAETPDDQIFQKVHSQNGTNVQDIPQLETEKSQSERNFISLRSEKFNNKTEETMVSSAGNPACHNPSASIGLKISALRKDFYELCKLHNIPINRKNFQPDTKSEKFKKQSINKEKANVKHETLMRVQQGGGKDLKKQSKWSKFVSGDHQKKVARGKRFQDGLKRTKRKHRIKTEVIDMKTKLKIRKWNRKMSFENPSCPRFLHEWRTMPAKLPVITYPVHRNHTTGSLDPLFQNINNGEISSQNGGMNFEWMRLKTFASFSSETNPRPIVLSRIGFYYTGRGKEVQCYSCGATYSDWTQHDDPVQVHRRISPQCRHLAGKDDRNVSVGHRESLGSSGASSAMQLNAVPAATSQTFSNPTSSQNNIQPQHIFSTHQSHVESNNGQLSTPTSTPATANHNYVERNNTGQNQESRHPAINGQAFTHQNTSNRSQNVTSSSQQDDTRPPTQTVNNGISSATINKLTPLGVNFDKPRYPQYAILTVRMSTYNGWPATQTPKQMADAGFIYAGYADYARCFFCGGGLRNWEEGDDPWIEHARWFPRCAYVRQNKGDQFVQLVHERLQEMASTLK